MKLLYPDWPAPSCVKAFTSLRHDNFTLSLDSKAGEKNRMRLFSEKIVPSNPFWLSQIHEATILPVDSHRIMPKADASYTILPLEVCVVLTADCLPILLTNDTGSFVAAIHAGWRGLALNIITKTLEVIAFHKSNILAWLGPAIGPTVYRVGNEVRNQFLKINSDNHIAFTLIDDNQWLCDLYTIARLELNKNQVTQVFGGNYCTYTQQSDFFSYRREGKNSGRMGSFIWRD